MNDILAAFGIEQLKKIETILDKKVELANAYFKHLSEFTEIKTPLVPTYVDRPSWYMYGLSLPRSLRNNLITHLDALKDRD